ncbi:Iduronate sulfatase [Planctomycetales bacterium 10988]|nr:Iduronate sulfatase [Planctomycetales bacterium 10988]
MTLFMNKWLALPLGALLLGMVLGSQPLAAQEETAERPNVLFIAVDDLNDWIEPLGGYPGTLTPNLTRLSERGVLFTNAHCAAPACNPSRVALLTGMRPASTGVYVNPNPWRPGMPDAVTIPQHFREAGYVANGCGKIFHGAYKDPQSWNTYYGQQGDPKPNKIPANGIPKTSHFDWGSVSEGDEAMSDWKMAEWASEQLTLEHDKPLFLAAGIFRPHLPWYAPEKYFSQYPLDQIQLPLVPQDDLDDIPDAGIKMAKPQGDHRKVVEHDQWRQAVQGYLASITFADQCIGKILDTLDETGQADNTIIVLWSDHGWHLGEKEHWRKFSLWDEATRVVFMVVAPGVTKPGTRCDRPVNLLDIYPTLIELCDLHPREELQGQSLVPLLKNPMMEWKRPSLTTHGRNNHSLRSDRWRYIRYEDGSEELYDHQADPYEWTNLADEEAYASIKKELAQWFPTDNVPEVPRETKTQQKKNNAKKVEQAKAERKKAKRQKNNKKPAE